MGKEINIYGILNNATPDGVIAKASQIKDDTENKKQSEINADYKKRLEKLEKGGGSGGTDNYNDLSNKPRIGGIELSGDKSAEELGLQRSGEYATKEELERATPYIGENGNWFVGGEDTGKPAQGESGVSLGEIALVQETGTDTGSENKVMSQMAVSQSLAKISSKINHENNVVTFGGNINKSVLDGEVGEGYYNLGSNTPTGGSSYKHTFIPVLGYSDITINTGETSCIISWYNENKEYVSSITNWAKYNNTVKRPDSAYFLQLSCDSAGMTEAITVTCLTEGVKLELQKQIETTEEGILAIINGSEAQATFDENNVEVGYYSNKGIYSNSGSYRAVFIPCRGGKSFTFNNSLSKSVIINEVDSDKTFISNISNWTSSAIEDAPLSDNTTFICLSVQKTGPSILEQIVNEITIKYQGVYGYADKIKKEIDESIKNLSDRFYRESIFNNTFTAKGGALIYQDITILAKEGSTVQFKVETDRECTSLQMVLKGSYNKYPFDIKKDVLNTWYSFVVEKDFPRLSIYTEDATSENPLKVTVTLKTEVTMTELVAIADVVDSCDSTASHKPLSANQGRILANEHIFYDSSYMSTRTDNTPFIKSLFIDCGRKYISPTYIKKFIDVMETKTLNALQLHFSENTGFRFALDDMIFNVRGEELDLSICLGYDDNGGTMPVDGADKWITQTEMDDIIEYARGKGIEIIPSFDMPGHFNAIANKFPGYGSDLKYELIKRYGHYFASRGSRFYNIGGDETGMSVENFMAFMGEALRIIISMNMTPILWNDLVCKNGYLDPFIQPGVVVMPWTYKDGQKPSKYIDQCGYRQINCFHKRMYCTFSSQDSIDTVFPERIAELKRVGIGVFGDDGTVPHLFGASMCIWNDGADLFGDDDGKGVYDNSLEFLNAFGDECVKYEKTYNPLMYAKTLEERIKVLEDLKIVE